MVSILGEAAVGEYRLNNETHFKVKHLRKYCTRYVLRPRTLYHTAAVENRSIANLKKTMLTKTNRSSGVRVAAHPPPPVLPLPSLIRDERLTPLSIHHQYGYSGTLLLPLTSHLSPYPTRFSSSFFPRRIKISPKNRSQFWVRPLLFVLLIFTLFQNCRKTHKQLSELQTTPKQWLIELQLHYLIESSNEPVYGTKMEAKVYFLPSAAHTIVTTQPSLLLFTLSLLFICQLLPRKKEISRKITPPLHLLLMLAVFCVCFGLLFPVGWFCSEPVFVGKGKGKGKGKSVEKRPKKKSRRNDDSDDDHLEAISKGEASKL